MRLRKLASPNIFSEETDWLNRTKKKGAKTFCILQNRTSLDSGILGLGTHPSLPIKHRKKGGAGKRLSRIHKGSIFYKYP
jgi:hypothetical protein